MSDIRKGPGMPALAQKDADFKRMYAECYENGSVDSEDGGKFVRLIVAYLQEHEKPRDWVREGVAEKDRFLERQKNKREPSQPALFGLEAIYTLGKVKDEKGVEKHRTVRGADMTVAQAVLHVEFRANYARSVLVDTELDLVPLRAAIAASKEPSEKVGLIAARLGLVEKGSSTKAVASSRAAETTGEQPSP